jgi:hypothetical protein
MNRVKGDPQRFGRWPIRNLPWVMASHRQLANYNFVDSRER